MPRFSIRIRRSLMQAAMALLWCVLAASGANAQQTHVLIVSGLSGDPAFKRSFQQIAATVQDAARQRWGVADSSVIVLTEDSVRSPRSRGQATREAIGRAMLTLSTRTRPGDVVLVLLLGHGSGEGAGSKVNLPGPDATASDYAGWIAGFARQTVVFINAATGSGDFLPVLQGPNRVIMTATRSAVERNASVFGEQLAAALSGDAADSDKDGRISVLEVFQYATREVAKVYDSSQRLQTEHAQLSDSTRALTISFGPPAAALDPRVAALMAERQALESAVAVLRSRKATMDMDAYERELERLLLAIAEKTHAIRALEGKR